MSTAPASELSPQQLADALREFVELQVAQNGGDTKAVKPGHRVQFHWPPHPVSYSYHIHPTEWRGEAVVEIHGETFSVAVANTPYGVFGRCEDLWLESKGGTLEEMLLQLATDAEPLFKRQYQIAKTLGRAGRFSGHIRDLSNLELLRLLYCPDRDVSHEAQTVIELRASKGAFLTALIEILRDRKHPYRRAAQWAVLDLFEDLNSFCKKPEDFASAVEAMRELIWDASDDYARTIYKAGVVLGGHLPEKTGGQTLMQCLSAPSPIGRRSAIHGLYHVVEWEPSTRAQVVAALREAAKSEEEPVLREYAEMMALDIEREEYDHVAEPVLPGEA